VPGNPYTVDREIDHLAAMVALAGPGVAILGHSFGGGVPWPTRLREKLAEHWNKLDEMRTYTRSFLGERCPLPPLPNKVSECEINYEKESTWWKTSPRPGYGRYYKEEVAKYCALTVEKLTACNFPCGVSNAFSVRQRADAETLMALGKKIAFRAAELLVLDDPAAAALHQALMDWYGVRMFFFEPIARMDPRSGWAGGPLPFQCVPDDPNGRSAKGTR
jgi:hypothetical protein